MPHLLLLLLSLLLACGRPSPTPRPPSPPQQPPPAKSVGQWRLTLGTSGGITGGGGGLEVWSDGSVFRNSWNSPSEKTLPEYLGTLPAEEMGSLYSLLKKAESVSHADYQNMTTSMSWKGLEPLFRHDWAWGSGDSPPSALAEVEAVLSKLEGLEKPTPEALHWGNSPVKARADLLIAQGQTYALTVGVGKEVYRVMGKGQPDLSGLVGKTLELEEKKGTLSIDKVEDGWLSGTHRKGEKKTDFRLPAWITVAP